MTDPDNTPVSTLLRAAEVGKAEGLNFIYAGNLPGRVRNWENTYCPGCGELLIERSGYRIRAMRVRDGACRSVPGQFPESGSNFRHLPARVREIRGILDHEIGIFDFFFQRHLRTNARVDLFFG